MCMSREPNDLLTTTQAADLLHMAPSTFRKEVNRAQQRGTELKAPKEDWPDLRSPRYDRELLLSWYQERPGHGYRTDLHRRDGDKGEE